MTLSDHQGLLYRAHIDNNGKNIALDLDTEAGVENSKEYSWSHMCASHPDTRRYLEENTKLDDLVIDALLAEDTRPRILDRPEGTMFILRAMNFMPGGKPEDMISLRIWIGKGQIITTRLRDALAIEDLKALVSENRAPNSVGAFVTAITDRVYSRMEPVIDDLEDRIARHEEMIAQQDVETVSDEAAPLRVKAAIIRRHVIPQRSALEKLIKTNPDWLAEKDLEQLIESDDQITRYVESLNDIRDRMAILNDEIARQNDQRMASTNYLFALAATIFLPLTFVTGLLGVNIGGMPGMQSDWAFAILVILCAVAVVIQIMFFRRKGWF